MNTAIFKTWLIQNGSSPKVATDTISRLKKLDRALIESPISSSIDSEFNKDICEQLLKCFSKSGKKSNYGLVSIIFTSYWQEIYTHVQTIID